MMNPAMMMMMIPKYYVYCAFFAGSAWRERIMDLPLTSVRPCPHVSARELVDG